MAVYVLQQLTQQWSLCGDSLKSVSRSGDTAELARLCYHYPSRSELVKACYKGVMNKDGDTALSLLAKFYRENPKKFNDFVSFASVSRERLHLFDMLPRCAFAPPGRLSAPHFQTCQPPIPRQCPRTRRLTPHKPLGHTCHFSYAREPNPNPNLKPNPNPYPASTTFLSIFPQF